MAATSKSQKEASRKINTRCYRLFPSLCYLEVRWGDQVITLNIGGIVSGKVQVEFVNTCSCCASYEDQVKEVARQYEDDVDGKQTCSKI